MTYGTRRLYAPVREQLVIADRLNTERFVVESPKLVSHR
jgi:hypothetical protein